MKYLKISILIIFAAIQLPLISSAYANSFNESEEFPQYDGSTHYNNTQQSTNETLQEFYIASQQAMRKGLKSFHNYALDITAHYVAEHGTKHLFQSELNVLHKERPYLLHASELAHTANLVKVADSNEITEADYESALYSCHDMWVRSDKYKRSYIEYVNSQL
ncbi:hypothetical protein ONE56_16285 [Vibrio mytili]|uniref:hypothetical protein n=1 Tax=Vibrio mytili TaxID=50718 RepID=UPI003C6FACCE